MMLGGGDAGDGLAMVSFSSPKEEDVEHGDGDMAAMEEFQQQSFEESSFFQNHQSRAALTFNQSMAVEGFVCK